MSPALLTAFSSASSNGTLPLTLTASVEQRAGISNKTGSFVLPLGEQSTWMGHALYEAVAGAVHCSVASWLQSATVASKSIVAITALIASVGAAGIPPCRIGNDGNHLLGVGLPGNAGNHSCR